MRRIVLWSTALVLALLAFAGCATKPSQEPVTLKIAISDNFLPVMRQLAQAYAAHQPWVQLEIHAANTAKLEDDLKGGAAFDIYIPARPQSMLALSQHDAINPKSINLLALNQLVVVAAADTDLSLSMDVMTTAEVRQIAVANPNLYLGYLTRESLTTMHMLPNHEAKPLVPTDQPAATPSLTPGLAALATPDSSNLEPKLLVLDNEANVIAAVEDGRAQVGITYASYALADRKVRILSPLPGQTHEPIAYNVAIPRNAPHNDEAWQFLNYLRSAEAQAIMQRSGLLVN